MNLSDAGQLLAIVKGAYPYATIDDGTIKVWAMLLNDVDPALALDTVARLCQFCERPPSIAQIRDDIAQRVLGLPAPEMAWDEVTRNVDRFAMKSGDVTWSCALVRDTAKRVGGMHGIRNSETPGVERGQFLRLYGEARERTTRMMQADLSQAAHVLADRLLPALAEGN